MAQSKNALLKGASGKIGDIVTFERDGTQVIREYVVPNDPKTPAQLAQRMKCEVANKGLSPLKIEIKRGHIGNSKAYRSAISTAMKNCIVGEYPNLSLVYSLIQIAEGKLQLPQNISVDIDKSNNRVNLNWISDLEFQDKPGRPDDKLNVVYFNEKFSVAKLLFSAPKRSDSKACFSLPDNWEISDTHIWVYMTSYSLSHNSDSLYFKL
ncbi:MAG: DUF6266 family protein [Fermentimonas sp.]|nr:DUF6266 family protein [Fermentimonas sp.]